jgi:succinate dehydrogenase hydrophobic anchor subunit
MSTIERPTRRYLGRPDTVAPGYVPGEPRATFDATRAADRSGLLWLIKAISGGLLIVFLGVHLVAQHLLAPGGLRDFASVVDYFHQPVALVTETLLVMTVLVHAATALRTFAAELVRGQRALRIVSYVIVLAAIGTFAYTVWLTINVLSWSA